MNRGTLVFLCSKERERERKEERKREREILLIAYTGNAGI